MGRRFTGDQEQPYHTLHYHIGQTEKLPGAEAAVWAQCAASR